MKILIKPQEVKCEGHWESKMENVVLVEKQEDIEPLFKLLCEQDEYWKQYKHLIKVAPSEIDSLKDLEKMCEYCGKTDIYDVPKLKEQISFILISNPYSDQY